MKTDFAWQRFVLPAFSLFWLILIWMSLFHAPTYRPGVILAPYGNDSMIVVSASPSLERAGLKPGVMIDSSRLSYANYLRLRGTHKGALVQLPIGTGGSAHTVAVRADTLGAIKPPLETWFEFVALTFSLVLSGYLGYRRPGIMVAAMILFIAGGALSWPELAVALSGLPDPVFTTIVRPLQILCSLFPTLALASFAIRLPNDNPSPKKRGVVRAIDGIVLFGLVLETLPYSRLAAITYIALSALVVIAACVLSLRLAEPSDRGRVGIVFAAVMLGGVGYALSIIVELYTGPTLAFYAYSNLSCVAVPVAVGYAILRHRVFDIGFVLNRTLVYALTSALVLFVLAALEFLAERYVTALTHVEGVLLEFVIALVVIVSARLIHQRIDHLVDNVLFRTRHEQESALLRFATAAQFYTEQEPLIRDTVDALIRFGRVQRAAVYLSDGKRMEPVASTFESGAEPIDENDPANVALRAHRDEVDTHEYATDFPGACLYPMVLAGRLAGVMATDERESGEMMPPDIADAIRRIASAVSISLAAIESDRVRQENATLHRRLAAIRPASA